MIQIFKQPTGYINKSDLEEVPAEEYASEAFKWTPLSVGDYIFTYLEIIINQIRVLEHIPREINISHKE